MAEYSFLADTTGRTEPMTFTFFDFQETRWLNVPELPGAPSVRQRHSATLLDETRILLFGGFNGTTWLNDVHILDVGAMKRWELFAMGGPLDLAKDMEGLLATGHLSDVTLIAGGTSFPVHRCVLAARTQYFSCMFSNSMLETKRDAITMEGWTAAAFRAMLHFIYTGSLNSGLDIERQCELLGLADQLALDSMKASLEKILVDSVRTSTVCRLLRVADLYQAHALKEACMKYFFDHKQEVSKADGFEDLAAIPTLLMEITKGFALADSRVATAPDGSAGGT
eukprot:Polyplicarium_translucidae@DN2451_c0_g1_i2.p1